MGLRSAIRSFTLHCWPRLPSVHRRPRRLRRPQRLWRPKRLKRPKGGCGGLAAAETEAAEEDKTAAAEATAAAESKTAAESKAAEGYNGPSGMTGLGSGPAAVIESVLRGRLQGPGHSGASGIANLATSLPLARGVAVISTFLQDPEEGLPLRVLLWRPSIRRLGCRRRRQ